MLLFGFDWRNNNVSEDFMAYPILGLKTLIAFWFVLSYYVLKRVIKDKKLGSETLIIIIWYVFCHFVIMHAIKRVKSEAPINPKKKKKKSMSTERPKRFFLFFGTSLFLFF